MVEVAALRGRGGMIRRAGLPGAADLWSKSARGGAPPAPAGTFRMVWGFIVVPALHQAEVVYLRGCRFPEIAFLARPPQCRAQQRRGHFLSSGRCGPIR